MTTAIERGLLERGRLERAGRPALAWQRVRGSGAATIVFLPGYASDMSGSKATALIDWAAQQGAPCLLFDYAGCGQSDGAFADQTLIDWRDDALAVIDALTAGPLLLVGSSMGGWLMLLVALARVERIAALVGIAAAPDFTDWGFTDAQKAALHRDGRLLERNPYGPEPTLTTLALWQSGEANRLLDATIPLDCPVRLLHGQDDGDVPPAISLRLAERLRSAEVVTSLVKLGDHRLSRPQDIALLLAAVADLLPKDRS